MITGHLKCFPEALIREVEGADGGMTTGAENFPGPVLKWHVVDWEFLSVNFSRFSDRL